MGNGTRSARWPHNPYKSYLSAHTHHMTSVCKWRHARQSTVYSQPQPGTSYADSTRTNKPTDVSYQPQVLRDNLQGHSFGDTGVLGMPAGSSSYGNTHPLTDVIHNRGHVHSNRNTSQTLAVPEPCPALSKATRLWVSAEKHRSA